MANQYRDPIGTFASSKAANDQRTWKDFARAAHCATSTVYNLVNGKTRRPTHRTVVGVLGAVGIKEQWVNGHGNPVKINYGEYLEQTKPKSLKSK